jgi:hypothetical protein
MHEALAHMEMLSDVARRGLSWSFRGDERAAENEG